MPRVPGLAWYALAGVVFLVGVALATILVWRFTTAFEAPTRFLAPGATELVITEPGEYIVWHEHRTVYQGRTFNVAAAMPDGTRYRIEAPDGRTLRVESHSGMSSEAGQERSVSVARFQAPAPGTYRVAVEGVFEPRVMAVAPNRVWPILKLAGSVFVLVLAALAIAVAIALYGFLRSVEIPPAGAAGAPAEGSVRKLAELVYGLQAASLLVGVTLFAGVIINYLRRRQAAGTWVESHFTWQIRTFWWSLAWCVLGVATAIVLIGVPILAASAIWFVYRIVKGWTELNEGRPMYA